MSFFASVLVGVSASFIASMVFLFVLYRLKPIIDISPYIADQTVPNSPKYAFKIINKTGSRIFDIKVQALLIEPVQVHGGAVNEVEEIPLLKDHFFEIGPYDLSDNDAHYALRFGTEMHLKNKWTSNTQYIRVNIVSKHALSGFSKVDTFIFNTPGSSIVKGKHVFGNNMKVKPVT